MREALSLALAVALSTVSPAAREVPVRLEHGAAALELRTCGVRDTLWIDHYWAGLYLPRGAAVEAVRDPAEPKALYVRIARAGTLPADIPRKWHAALGGALGADAMARLSRTYRDLRDGDVLFVGYAPQRGVTMQVNGATVVTAEGHRVIDAMLETWAARESAEEKLRRLVARHAC